MYTCIPTRRLVLLAVTLFLACVLYVVIVDVDTVNVRTWVLDANNGVPELTDDELAVPGLRDRPSFGVAFSGGGTRSAAASLGQLRALHELGWLRRARHVTSNSGGSWAIMPYIYLPLAIDQEQFLGDYIPPAEFDG